MKKLFYIVLVIVILLVIGQLLRSNIPAAAPTDAETVRIDTVVEDSAVVTEDENGNMVVDGEIVEDIEEENPSATSDEQETIISE